MPAESSKPDRRELYNQPRNLFVAGFLGSPKMNFLAGKVKSRTANGTVIDLTVGGTLAVAGALSGFSRGGKGKDGCSARDSRARACARAARLDRRQGAGGRKARE